MEYTMKFNERGNLNGWQEVHYYLNGSSVRDAQRYDNGVIVEWMCFTSVHQNGRHYSFMASDWGTVEIARDAAERFTTASDYQFQYHNNEAGGWDIRPNTEEAFVLA